jgi:hypothetical protein
VFHEGSRKLHQVLVGGRRLKSGAGPQLPSDQGEGVNEGGPCLGVPGSPASGPLSLRQLLMRKQGDQREETKQSRSGPSNGVIGPVALGPNAQVLAHFIEGDAHLPPEHEPGNDLFWRHIRVGTQEALRRECTMRIVNEDPANRNRLLALIYSFLSSRFALWRPCVEDAPLAPYP